MIYEYKEMVPYLLDWFDYNARILPWRDNPKPYYVWISEIMLQQTRVEAVKGYFDRFTDALPQVKALSDVDEDRLLKLWEGLGYYNRARNLKKAAQILVNEYGGELPADYDQLLQLPGIGTYTAGAISSIAFQIPVPAVDGNVLRVTKRLSASYDDISKEKVKKELWKEIHQVIPKDRPGDFNQALMELGATVCLPNGKPHCEQCPVMHLCQAFKKDIVMDLPVKPSKKQRRIEDKTVLLVEHQGRYAIRKRGATGLLAGLWELPNWEGEQPQDQVKLLLEEYGIEPGDMKNLGKAKHIFSHIEWHMIGYHVLVKNAVENSVAGHEIRWVTKEELKNTYSLPTAFSAYASR